MTWLAAAGAVAAAGLALLWWGVRTPGTPGPPPTRVLLVTIDTLRADALGAYGNTAAATPWLDRLATGGIRFENAHAHNVVTLPSHANILTGRLPPEHGVHDNAGFRLLSRDETLATWLKGRGFRTAAFVSAFPLDSRFGLDRGFDVYDDRFADRAPRPAMIEQERPARDTIAAARQWMNGQDATTPWFCWIHLFEPHFPYAPPEPFASRFAEAPYAGEVAAVDAALGSILQPILDSGASTRTLVIVTADHGEALGEHDEATHGIFAYEATLRVPLFVYYPPLLQPATSTRPAAHVDVMPTILQLLQLPAPPGLRGRNLVSPGSGETDDVTYFEALSGSLNRGWAPLTGVIARGYKFIDLPLPELYDLHRDPAERHNLAASQPEQMAELQRLLAPFAVSDVRRTNESPETRERLRSLGYVSSSAPRSGRPYRDEDDPKRLIRFETGFQQVTEAYLAGNLREALARSRKLVNDQPRMRVAWLQLAQLERDTGDLNRGIDALKRAVALEPGDSEAVSLLAAYLTEANRAEDAIALLQPHASAAEPDPQVLTTLALAQAKASRTREALDTIERARRRDPTNAMLLVHAGTIHLMAGKRNDARKAFEAAVSLNPDAARAHSSLGALAAEEGRTEEALSHWRRAVALDPGEHRRLLGVAIALAGRGRTAEARHYMQLFVDSAPPSRFGADIARARAWLEGRGEPRQQPPERR